MPFSESRVFSRGLLKPQEEQGSVIYKYRGNIEFLYTDNLLKLEADNPLELEHIHV